MPSHEVGEGFPGHNSTLTLRLLFVSLLFSSTFLTLKWSSACSQKEELKKNQVEVSECIYVYKSYDMAYDNVFSRKNTRVRLIQV
jgi:hypothetical protein